MNEHDDTNLQHQSEPIIEGLAQAARVLQVARRLPMGQLTEEQISGVRADWMSYSRVHGLFDAQVARELGVSGSVLSQFRNGSYRGDMDRIARKLNDWMEHHARKQRASLPREYCHTWVAEMISTIVEHACVAGSMAAIVAPSGAGKTMVLKVLCEKWRGRYIYCSEDLSPRSFLAAVAKAVDVGCGGVKADLLERIIEKLRGTARPLFLDEAHQLPKESLSRLRALHDCAETPIIMAGTHEVLTRINDRTDGRGQFASRCVQFNVLEHVLNAEHPRGGSKLGRPLFTVDEVKGFLETLKVRLDRGALDLAWAVACLPNHGCLRTLRRIVMLLRRDVESRNEPIARGELLQALELCFGQLGASIGRLADVHIRLAAEAA
jgi:DNA transposition AAA+ family ATPase